VFPTKEHLEDSHRLHEFAAEIRDKFLNSTAWVETLLSDILAGYFCPNDKCRGLFFSEVVNATSCQAVFELTHDRSIW
jgi:hypothetical protein